MDAGVVKDPKAFGEALKTQAGRDAASRFAGPGTLFAGVSSIRLAAAGAPQQATPRFPMHTVKILATGADGKPAVASAGVVNTDDARKGRTTIADASHASETLVDKLLRDQRERAVVFEREPRPLGRI